MGLRPAKCYRGLERPYTRQSRRKPKKGYVKGVPYPKITKFETGAGKKDFDLTMYLVAKGDVQIRHNALEASRIAANKVMFEGTGEEGYFLKVLVFPHHVLRENPLATGAGADRFQTGMRMSFGKPIGTAARVKVGQKIIEVRTSQSKIGVAKLALKAASYKLPVKCVIA